MDEYLYNPGDTIIMKGEHYDSIMYVARGVIIEKKLTSFSESQLLDCDYKLLKNKACNGGLPTWAY